MTKKKNKLWSVTRITDPRYPEFTLRIAELKPGGNLYAMRRVDGKQRMASIGCSRKELGSTAREQEDEAKRRALNMIEALAEGGPLAPEPSSVKAPEPGEGLTLKTLADLYEEHGLHGRSEGYKRDQPKRVRRVIAVMGPDRDVRSLCKTDVEAFSAHRKANGIRQGTIASDLARLKIALNWATEHKRSDGQPLIAANPLAKVKIEQEQRPRRPVAGEERFNALKEVAEDFPPQLGLSLDLVWATGHRIGAVLDLRWEHVKLDPEEAARLAASLDSEVDWSPEHFPLGGIHWYAGKGTDNKKHEHVSPMNVLARDAIMEARPDIVGPGWIFPAPTDATKRIGYHVLKRWFEKAEKQAELPHLQGGLWHPFRRGWATARKHLPTKDVAKGGGWRDEATMQRCYVRADGETILSAVNAG